MPSNDELTRRIVYAVISALLTFLAARLAMYLTNKILGQPDDGSLIPT